MWACALAAMLIVDAVARTQEVLLPLQTAPAARVAAKTADTALGLPFFDDFATDNIVPTSALWQGGGALSSQGARLRPPTVGVVTLDAIDAEGNLYESASTSTFPADTLMSRRIRLNGLEPSDSVVLSFYYLPGGGKGDLWNRVGDAPNMADSIYLDFYNAADSVWVTVWSRGGTTVDSLIAATGREWQYVAIAITDSMFFDSSFCFRFRNHCSLPYTTKAGLSGNCDYWHLDYILLDSGRESTGDPVFRDVAFVDPAPSMLQVYRAMPARQYRTADMAQTLEVTITNLFNSDLATQYRYAVVDENGDTLYRYNGGYENSPPFLPDAVYQTAPAHATPPVGYSYPEDSVARSYTVVHTVSEGVVGDDTKDNDTVRFYQVFDNYYAYDDGSAENGYGLTSTASNVFLAYRFDLNEADSLTAVELYFNRTLDDENAMVPFKLAVWRDDDGRPGDLIYQDPETRFPNFEGMDRFHCYELAQAVALEAGSVFIGFNQGNNYYINLGFDRSNNTADRIWYRTSTAWQQSILFGSLMMRPCFGQSSRVGIEEQPVLNEEWNIFPNPANLWLNIAGMPEGGVVTLYDITGRQVAFTQDRRLAVDGLAEGVYVVRCLSRDGEMGIKKLIIKH